MATTPTPEPELGAELELPRTWFLTGDELDATRAKIATLNARARAKGFTGTVEITADAVTRSYTPAPGAPPVTVHGFDVTITGSPPAYRGWLFLAAIDQLPSSQPGDEPGVILRYPPGADQSIDNSDLRPGECDHCHTIRPRTTTYLVRHTDTGELMQVGRTCLKDFLGWSTTPILLDAETIAADIERHLGTRAAGPWDLESVLTYAWAVVETYGWTPASAAGSQPATRDLVDEAMRGGRPGQQVLASIADHLDPAPHMAARIIAELAPTLTGDSGYEANLAALLRSGRVDPAKHLGLAVSAVHAWHRLHERDLAHQTRDAQRAEIRHAGQVGQKVTLTGTITTRIPVDGSLRLPTPDAARPRMRHRGRQDDHLRGLGLRHQARRPAHRHRHGQSARRVPRHPPDRARPAQTDRHPHRQPAAVGNRAAGSPPIPVSRGTAGGSCAAGPGSRHLAKGPFPCPTIISPRS